ncbi:HNH endonuclease [bacterium]|nr:HNH endonuclease [bacterium]
MKHSDKEIIEICNDALTMSRAAAELGMHFNTFKRHATRLGVYKPNQSGKGTNKRHNGSKIELTSILEGNHPSYQTNKLRIRLIKEGIKNHECECCGLTKWLDNPISLELDHIDGNRFNHKLSNLRIVCPNCHSQTSTYRGKNIR